MKTTRYTEDTSRLRRRVPRHRWKCETGSRIAGSHWLEKSQNNRHGAPVRNTARKPLPGLIGAFEEWARRQLAKSAEAYRTSRPALWHRRNFGRRGVSRELGRLVEFESKRNRVRTEFHDWTELDWLPDGHVEEGGRLLTILLQDSAIPVNTTFTSSRALGNCNTSGEGFLS